MAKAKTKAKLPKRFAGIKIPKRVRKGPLGDFIASPAGQLVVAEVVATAGGTLVARKLARDPGARRAAGRSLAGMKHAASNGAEEVGAATSKLTYAIGEAARTFSEALQHDPDETPNVPAVVAAKKKTPARTSSSASR